MSRSLTLRACLFIIALISFTAFLLFGLFAPASAPVSALALPEPKSTTLADHPSGLSDCGPAWQVMVSPNVTSTDQLHGVAAVSDTDVWAVGYSYDGHTSTLIEHWEGSAWSVVPSPNLGSDSELLSVSAVSATDVWAVGNGPQATLTEHWDGTSWRIVPSPSVGTDSNSLHSVAAISSNDVWAVGTYFTGIAHRALIEHWNGSAWDIVRSPNVGGGD